MLAAEAFNPDVGLLAVAVRGRRKVKPPVPRPRFTVLLSAEVVGDFIQFTIEREFGARLRLEFVRFHDYEELMERAREGRFDAVIVYAMGLFGWAEGRYADYVVEALTLLRQRFGKPVFAYQGRDLMSQFKGSGVQFIAVPFVRKDLVHLLRCRLEG